MTKNYLADINIFTLAPEKLQKLLSKGHIHISDVTYAEAWGRSCKAKRFGPITLSRALDNSQRAKNTVETCLKSGGRIVHDPRGVIFSKNTQEQYEHLQSMIDELMVESDTKRYTRFHKLFTSHIINLHIASGNFLKANRDRVNVDVDKLHELRRAHFQKLIHFPVIENCLQTVAVFDKSGQRILDPLQFAHNALNISHDNLSRFYQEISRIDDYVADGSAVRGKFSMGGKLVHSKYDIYDFYQCLIAKKYRLALLTENSAMEDQVNNHPVTTILVNVHFQNYNDLIAKGALESRAQAFTRGLSSSSDEFEGIDSDLSDVEMDDDERFLDVSFDDGDIFDLEDELDENDPSLDFSNLSVGAVHLDVYNKENTPLKRCLSEGMLAVNVKMAGGVPELHSPQSQKSSDSHASLNTSIPSILTFR